jgi:hypothetical protein
MKKSVILLISSLMFVCVYAQEYSLCYRTYHGKGVAAYSAGDYAKAKEYFQAIHQACVPKDIPEKNDIDSWIQQCEDAIVTGKLKVKKLNDNYGFMDEYGKEVIPLSYSFAWPFSEGLACVAVPSGPLGVIGLKWGYIDRTGKEVIPFKYDYALSFSEGLALVNLNGKCGYIDRTGKEVIPCKYDHALSFSEGLAPVRLNGKWGYIDKTEKIVLPFKYNDARPFSEGFALVSITFGHGWFRIDKTGKIQR